MDFIDQAIGFLISQLSHIESKVYEKQYAEINYPKIIPISTEAGEGATAIDYFHIDAVGVAKFIGPKSIDVPLADIAMQRVSVPVELGAMGYTYSDEEIRQAIMLSRSLETLKATAARRSVEQHIQSVYMTGDTEHALPGFLNNANVAASSVADGAGGDPEWSTKTGDEIVLDVNTLFTSIFTNTKMRERANRLLLPPAQYTLIANTRLGSVSDTTILEYLVSKSIWLNSVDDVIPVNELTGAGAGSTDRMVAYSFDSDKVIAHMPMPLRFDAPQRKGLGFEIPGQYKISGVEFRYPGSAQYADEI